LSPHVKHMMGNNVTIRCEGRNTCMVDSTKTKASKKFTQYM
jgi:hypothetical protein